MEQQLKKYSIGYNTISSVDGVINARGVKSYPNNLEIYGYTHEIGTGEKSPDNPYILKSLDSGNVNLYSKDKIIRNTVGKTTTTGKVVYGIELPHPKTGYYCVKSDPSTEYPLTYNLYDIETNVLAERGWNIAINSNNSDTGRIIKVDDGLGLLLYDCRDNNYNAFTNRTNLMILDSPIMPSEYITDEHSILIQNNDMSIQVPVPIPLNSVEGVSDYIYKDSNGVWKLKQMCEKYEFNGIEEYLTRYSNTDVKIPVFYITEKQGLKTKNNTALICNYYNENPPGVVKSERKNFSIWNYSGEYPTLKRIYMIDTRFTTIDSFKSFLSKQYANGTPLTIVYQLETPIEHVLSDYAQDLLNSFTLQNQNEISVEGNPDIKISGYIQK